MDRRADPGDGAGQAHAHRGRPGVLSVERGTAAFRSEGNTGLPERGLLDFADYRTGDGRLLSFQRVQGGQWEASYARPLTPGSIRVDRLP